MIKAIEDKVVVSELKRSQTSAGILIPATAIEPQAYGKILSIGDALTEKPIKVGDIIVYHKMGGQAISMNNKILCCVPYPEIYGILEDETLLSELEEIETTAIQGTPELAAPSLIKSV
jgi:co-chaperonin GroES (HSP10)